MNYQDVALTDEQIQELKKTHRKTGWRLKALKTEGKTLPDSETTNVTKINWTGGYDEDDGYHNVTQEGRYKKMIHDERSNRSFILHNTYTDTTEAVVSIINHNLDPAHTNYVETISSSVSADWPIDYRREVRDITFDPTQQLLAIAVTAPEGYFIGCCGLFVIDCRKYLPEASTTDMSDAGGYCSGTLEENLDYLKCTPWLAGDDIMGNLSGSEIKFVRYYKNRFYTWARLDNINRDDYYQLGYFKGDHEGMSEYKLILQDGASPITWNAGDMDGSVTFPLAQGYWDRISDLVGPSWGSGDCYIGDPVTPFRYVTSFEINDAGILVMGTRPYSDRQNDFGTEGCLLKFDLEKEGQPVSNIWFFLGAISEYNPETEMYEIPDTFVKAHFDGSWVKGFMRVETTLYIEAAPDLASYIPDYLNNSCQGFVQTRFGTVRLQGDHTSPNGGGSFAFHTIVSAYEEEHCKIGFWFPDLEHEAFFQFSFRVSISNICAEFEEAVGDHIPGFSFRNNGDNTQMETVPVEDEDFGTWNLAKLHEPNGDDYVWIQDAVYDSQSERYVTAVYDNSDSSLGLWVIDPDDRYRLEKYPSMKTGLEYPRVGILKQLGDGVIALVSTDGLYPQGGRYTKACIQFYDIENKCFIERKFEMDPPGYSGLYIHGLVFDKERSMVGLCAGHYSFVASEAWFWRPDELVSEWTRDPRKWWDGSMPDAVIGDSEQVADTLGQGFRIFNPTWTQSKGQSSYRLSFEVYGAEYLPWSKSPLNESPVLTGSYSGLFRDGTRFIVERGIFDGNEWSWVQEGQVFIVASPVNMEDGLLSMEVTCMGPISLLVNRATYVGSHKPDLGSIENGSMTAESDGVTYSYLSGGEVYSDWALNPQPVIKVDGQVVSGYSLDSANGIVTFDEEPTGAVSVTFDYYIAGTNEPDEMIRCILTYPQELGGCGIDESYFTRTIEAEQLVKKESLRYAFSKNNVIPDAVQNQVYYLEGGSVPSHTWDYQNGTVTFSQAPDSEKTIVGDCSYFTIQYCAMTLKPFYFDERTYANAYQCINEICRRVAPNYIFREGRDGKLECNYFTQKSPGALDLNIEDDDIIINSISDNPAYEGLATRVISLGQAELEELPNLCQGRSVDDLWTANTAGVASPQDSVTGWHPGVDVNSITDGDPGTGATTGYGGLYGKRGNGDAIQQTLVAQTDGMPCISIDLGEVKEVGTVIVARPSQVASEGSADPLNVQTMSIWISSNADAWEELVPQFSLPPGRNIKFVENTNFDKGTAFQYIRINMHRIGYYMNGGQVDTQMGISEVQCYEPEVIVGEAVLQDEDYLEPLYDENGLLARYGLITHLARGGNTDPALYSKDKADLDARYTLEEIVRLISAVEVNSPWLPGIPIFSTIRVTNETLGVTRTFFVENRTASANGDSYSGTTLP